MPRVRPLTSGDRMDTYLLAVIDKYMRLAGIKTYGALGSLMGKGEATATRRIRSPGNFQYDELRALAQRLKIPPEELLPAFYERGQKK